MHQATLRGMVPSDFTQLRMCRHKLARACISCINITLLIGWSIWPTLIHFHLPDSKMRRDCNRRNFMVDPSELYPNGYHPQSLERARDRNGPARHLTRTQRPPKYYLIDFGISRKYNPADGPPLESPILGGDKTVPEYSRSPDPCDPFPVDVYYAGNLIRRDFLDVRFDCLFYAWV
jgi:hypothetical protein